MRRWSCAVLLVVGAAAGCSTRGHGGVTPTTRALSTSNGIVPNGLTTNGIWGNGIWGNGIWGNGIWGNGIWGNGIWGNGIWGNGIWGNGIWGNGIWGNGIWGNGIWGNGAWSQGLWANATWSKDLTGSAAVPGDALRNSKYARQLLQYIYQCAMPGALDPITNTPNPTSYDTTLDPAGGTLLCTPGAPGTDPVSGCPDSTYTCSAQGTCVIPMNGAVGLAINGDGSGWWGEAPDGTFPDYTKAAINTMAGACDETCQRWISACVLARTNAYGVHVQISMRAPANAPQAIRNALQPSAGDNDADSETKVFHTREGAYYGNIFETTPVPDTPPSAGYTGPAPGPVAQTPIYTACAGPDSNVPEITKRFESSQGDQVVIKVPGICLATALERGTCAGSDTDPSSPTYQSIQHCYTQTSLKSANACATIPGPLGVAEPSDTTCYDQVITVFLADPIAVCGNTICEPPTETPDCCPTDCHPATWAKDFPPLLKTGSAYLAPACSAADSAIGNCPQPPPVVFAPNSMSAVAADSSIAVVGTASVDICPDGCPLSLGSATLPASDGVGVLVKYDAKGNYAWPSVGVRFGSTPPLSTVRPLESVTGVVVGSNPSSAPTSPDHTGNITVTGITTEVGTSNQQIWISSFQPDGTPLGTWIPQLVGTPKLSPSGGALAFDSQSNLVLAVNTLDQPASKLSNVAAIALGGGAENNCAIMPGGTLDCWGDNGYGELGNGTLNNSPFVPVPVLGLSGATAVAMGRGWNCALQSGGTVECWGQNVFGQLGIGTTKGPQTTPQGGSYSGTPLPVSGLAGATAIATGFETTCALVVGGSVLCWGTDEFSNTTTTPTAVPGLTGATSISLGGGETACAVMSGGTVQCWGNNLDGELGNGSTTGSTVPVTVPGLTGVTAVSVGNYNVCALLSSGTVECWGRNDFGQLGIGTATGPQSCGSNNPCSTTPLAVTGLSGPVTALGVGYFNVCALLLNGTVECWGRNELGELGIGTESGPETCADGSACSTTPVAVDGLTAPATALSVAGDGSACALLSDSTVECWGDGRQILATPARQAPLLFMKTALPAGVPEAPVVWMTTVYQADGAATFTESLAVDPNDNVIAVAAFGQPNLYTQGTLYKICSDGSLATGLTCPDGSKPWSTGSIYSAAVVDSSGDIYAGSVRLMSQTQGTPYVAKFDTNGNNLWRTATGNSSSATCAVLGSGQTSNCASNPVVEGVSMGFDGGGNVVMASFGNPAIGGGINFGSPLPTFPTYGSPNIFLSAYDHTTGSVEWAKQIPMILSGSLHGMALGNQGQIVLSGNYSGSMQVDGQLLVTAVPESSSTTDSFLASFAEPAPITPAIGTTAGTCGGPPFDTVPSAMYVPATSPDGACVFFTPPTSTWATTVTCSPPPNSTFPLGQTKVTCTAYDAYGNTPQSPSIFYVNVIDPPPPALGNVPANITQTVTGPTAISYAVPTVLDQLDNPSSCSSCAAPLAPVGPPGPPPVCAPPPVLATCTPASGSTFPLGTTTVSCTTSDVGGRSASATFTVTLIPEVTTSCVGAPGAPAIVPAPAGACGVTVSDASAVAGTCGGAELELCTFGGQASETLGLGNYTIPVVGTAVDLSTTSTCTSYVSVVDTQNPVITCSTARAECTGAGTATVTPGATCTDNCSCTARCATGTFPLGTSQDTCSATDPSGNNASCQATVQVVDTTPPALTLNVSPSTLQCGVDKYVEAGAKASDTCAGDLTSTITETGSVTTTAPGTYTVSYSVKDPSGNAAGASRTVSVVDTLAPTTAATVGPSGTADPTITIKITSYTVTPTGGGATVSGSASCWTSPGVAIALSAGDACALKQLIYALSGAQTGGATVAGGNASFTVTKAGSTTVSYYATDKAGNKEATHTIPIYVGHHPLGFGFSCAPSLSLKSLPPHGAITAKGTVTITSGKQTITQSFSFTQSY
jgi:alpha-tubulin suppressor-like RCC1 family protein